MKQTTSATLMPEEENALKFNTERILKAKPYKSFQEMINHNKDGTLSMLMKPRKSQLRVLIKIGDSISIDHSTLDQDFQ
jgi:hypothetical protein